MGRGSLRAFLRDKRARRPLESPPCQGHTVRWDPCVRGGSYKIKGGQIYCLATMS